MNAAATQNTPVVVLAMDEAIASTVRNALGQVGIASVLWLPGETEQPARPPGLPGMLIMQGGCDVDGVIREGVTRGWLSAGMPVILIAPEALDRDQRREWLQAGAWEIVRLPLDEELFGLQVRNFLRGRSGDAAHPATGAYSREALVKVTEENLSLARRYSRPLAIAAFGLDWGQRRADANAVALLERLAATAHEATRRSDLVGVTARGTLLTLLPDTDRAGAQIFTDRLAPRLEARLREWGVLARVLRGRTMADEKFKGSAEEFLRAAEDAIS